MCVSVTRDAAWWKGTLIGCSHLPEYWSFSVISYTLCKMGGVYGMYYTENNVYIV